jgi:hypothetical protein
VFIVPLSFAQQPPAQLTQVPPKPTCTPFFTTGSCVDLWRTYNQAFQQRQREELQLYVNRQKDIASAEAIAPLQQQIGELKKLSEDEQQQITKLNDQIQTDAATDIHDKSAAHQDGLQSGIEIGVAGTLVLFALIFTLRRFTQNYSVTKKEQSA